MSERVFGFVADTEDLVFYNGKALINLAFYFEYNDDAETIFDFAGYVSAYFRVYNERNGQLLKNFTSQVTRNSNILVMNCSVADMTFSDNGKYYYEMGFNSNGYEVPLRYGKCEVI